MYALVVAKNPKVEKVGQPNQMGEDEPRPIRVPSPEQMKFDPEGFSHHSQCLLPTAEAACSMMMMHPAARIAIRGEYAGPGRRAVNAEQTRQGDETISNENSISVAHLLAREGRTWGWARVASAATPPAGARQTTALFPRAKPLRTSSPPSSPARPET